DILEEVVSYEHGSRHRETPSFHEFDDGIRFCPATGIDCHLCTSHMLFTFLFLVTGSFSPHLPQLTVITFCFCFCSYCCLSSLCHKSFPNALINIRLMASESSV